MWPSQAKRQSGIHRSKTMMAHSGQAPPQEPMPGPLPSRSTFHAPFAKTRNPSLWRRILGRAHHATPARPPTPEPAPGPERKFEPAPERRLKTAPEQRPEPTLSPTPAPAPTAVAPAAEPVPEPEKVVNEEVVDEKVDGLDPDDPRLAPPRRTGRQVVPGLPRALTFKRQKSELRDNLMPAELSTEERRALSMDRRVASPTPNRIESQSNPCSSTADVHLDTVAPTDAADDDMHAAPVAATDALTGHDAPTTADAPTTTDAPITTDALTGHDVPITAVAPATTDAPTATAAADATTAADAQAASDSSADSDRTVAPEPPSVASAFAIAGGPALAFPTSSAAASAPALNFTISSPIASQDLPSAPSPSLASTTPAQRAQNHDPRTTVDTLDLDHTKSHAEPRPRSSHGLKPPVLDTASMTTSQYDQLIHDDLERIWILNLSMHFRDKSKREKFFITYRQSEFRWRRVTVSLDYRNAPESSLELDLEHTKFQREKNAKIYEAIRESLQDIQFYDTVTNLKLQTTDGRLHVHVVEDVNEIIQYPTLRMVSHLRCRRVREHEIQFDSHMSGFVYKVKVHGQTLIKKEIPGPDTVDEFLYEVNALTQLQDSKHVIELYGVIVDDNEEHVKGLLISYAERGALIDMIYDNDHRLPWERREKWARQIVAGLAEIHEAGFVQGDFTLSNIVIDSNDDAKIIDINRRGCPVGWEPPEATPLIESGQRISMYIGVKSDLFQLGMVLWAIATQEDEPETHNRPLRIDPDIGCPSWFRDVVDMCLCENPRFRVSASILATRFPGFAETGDSLGRHHQYARYQHAPTVSMDSSVHAYGPPVSRPTNSPPPEWTLGHRYVDPPTGTSNEPYYFPTRGRSPPSPIASHRGGLGTARGPYPRTPAWSAYSYDQSRSDQSISEELDMDIDRTAADRSVTPRTNSEPASAPVLVEKELTVIGLPLHVSADDLSEVVAGFDGDHDVTPRAEEEKAEAEPTTAFHSQLTIGQYVHPWMSGVGDELQPEGVPLPASPAEATEDGEKEDGSREDEAATSESGGASLDWHDMDDDDIRDPRVWFPPHEPRWDTGITEPETRANVVKSFITPTTTEAEAAPTTTTMEANIERMRTPSTGRWLAIGTESLHGDGVSILEVARDSNPPTTTKADELATPPGSTSATATPTHELPDELKGIGSAHDHSNEEELRAQGSILDDFDRLDGQSGHH